jgi:hypothetical protein
MAALHAVIARRPSVAERQRLNVSALQHWIPAFAAITANN